MGKMEKMLVDKFRLSVNAAYNIEVWAIAIAIIAGGLSLVPLMAWLSTPLYTGDYIIGKVHEVSLRDGGERMEYRILVVEYGGEYGEFHRPPPTVYYSVAEGDSVVLCVFKRRGARQTHHKVSLTVAGCDSIE